MSASNDARRAWDANAAFWNKRMGDGNDFFEMLLWPPITRLLDLRPGESVLDVACGNGITTRRLQQLGTRVTGIDFSERQLEHARARSPEIDYRRVDCTDIAAVAALGEHDAVLCNMALMDIADPAATMRSVARALRPGGRFVFSIVHPAFNNPWALRAAELEDRDGEIRDDLLREGPALPHAGHAPRERDGRAASAAPVLPRPARRAARARVRGGHGARRA